jgi:hypothetical protein
MFIKFKWIWLCVLFALIISQNRDQYKSSKHASFLINPSIIKFLSFGHTASIANFIWIEHITSLGSSVYGQEYQKKYLQKLRSAIIYLNPKFRPVYQFDLLLSEESLYPKIHKQITKYFSDDWRIMLYYSNNIIITEKNYDIAAKIMEPFKYRKDIPAHIRTIYLTYKNKNTNTKAVLLELVLEYSNTTNYQIKVLLKNKIAKTLNITSEHSELTQILKQIEMNQPTPVLLKKMLNLRVDNPKSKK